MYRTCFLFVYRVDFLGGGGLNTTILVWKECKNCGPLYVGLEGKKESRKTLVEGESSAILGPPNVKGYWGSWRGTEAPECKADHLPPF